MAIRRVTTPWIRYNAGNLTIDDFNSAKAIEFTARQGDYIIKKEKDELVYGVNPEGEGILGFQLTQEESGKLTVKELVYLQVRILTATEQIRSSRIVHTRVKNVLSDSLLGVEDVDDTDISLP